MMALSVKVYAGFLVRILVFQLFLADLTLFSEIKIKPQILLKILKIDLSLFLTLEMTKLTTPMKTVFSIFLHEFPTILLPPLPEVHKNNP